MKTLTKCDHTWLLTKNSFEVHLRYKYRRITHNSQFYQFEGQIWSIASVFLIPKLVNKFSVKHKFPLYSLNFDSFWLFYQKVDELEQTVVEYFRSSKNRNKQHSCHGMQQDLKRLSLLHKYPLLPIFVSFISIISGKVLCVRLHNWCLKSRKNLPFEY